MIENDAEIRRTVLARDALRKEAHLPPLNVEQEVEKGRKLAASKAASERYQEQCDEYASDRQRIRDEIIAEMRTGGNTTYPNGWAGKYHLSTLVEKRFQSFLLNGVGDAK
ncbi:hypothetical protein [Methylobacterium sp. WL8]|uniref:hypothetical protein n=1 Tax=Methylobacterium sp. WL8 TaxID=2603899 RepID=UPI0011CB1471|nr:hypothetical protein [Methylobacterium sp. WL8]TXN80040.1 hypothetical protein FV234_18310 [Methylobacterium sp. WL8]